MIRILFVCHGNICRSPMAEFVLKKMTSDRGIAGRFDIASAATTTEEIWGGRGNPVYPSARKVLLAHGIDPAGKYARLMTRADYQEYDYLIGMDDENICDMRDIAGGDPQHKICRLLDFTGHPRDVADPWYTRKFDKTWTDVVCGCEGLLEFLKRKGDL